MKRYKLIREYPGSPKLGKVVKLDGRDWYITNDSQLFPKNEVENFPKFWEKVIEKDYEILSMCDNNSLNICFIENELQSKSLYHDGFNIHSVKRLSDSEVFTVGDEYEFGIITGFHITGHGIFLENKNCYHSCLLKLANKVKKKPLFTTEDGVDIFEGDKFWYVTKDLIVYMDKCNSMTGGKIVAHSKLGDKYFSTKEKAEEYILMNKRLLSYNDVITILENGLPIQRTKYSSLIKKFKKILINSLKTNES